MSVSRRIRSVAAAALVGVVTVAAAPQQSPVVHPLAVGSLVVSRFTASRGHVVDVVAAVFPRDRVTIRVVDHPAGGPLGETVVHALQGKVLAAINGAYFTEDFEPDGLYEIDAVVRRPARSGLSGVVGSAKDGAPVVARAGAVDPAMLRDAVQSGPFVVDPGGTLGIWSDDGQRARRSLVVVSAGRIAFVTTAKCGLYDLARALVASPRAFGVDRVERALNLDGGPSSALAVRLPSNSVFNVPETGKLRTVLTIEPRK